MVRLETDRLTIRDYRESDLASYHELVSCDTAMRYLPEIRCQDVQHSSRRLCDAVSASNLPNRSKHYFAIGERASDKHIGGVGFTIVRKDIGQRIG